MILSFRVASRLGVKELTCAVARVDACTPSHGGTAGYIA